MKDSGQREGFKTGAVRDIRYGKGRFDLETPEFRQRIANVMEAGARKYGERNWEKGIPLSRSFDSLQRHLNQWLTGLNDEDHLAHAAANIMFLITIEDRALDGRLPIGLVDAGPYSAESNGDGTGGAGEADLRPCDEPDDDHLRYREDDDFCDCDSRDDAPCGPDCDYLDDPAPPPRVPPSRHDELLNMYAESRDDHQYARSPA